jgi:hypothetical protein
VTGPPAATPPGAQAERTRLAWRRSVLAGSVTVLLLGREALYRGGAVPAVLAGAGVVLWALLALFAQRRIHAMAEQRPAAPTLTGVGAAGALVLALAAAAVLTVLT